MGTNTTPKYALPWPDGAERVMDGDNAIGALANAVEAVLASHGAALQAMLPSLVRSNAQLVLTTAYQAVPGATFTYTPAVYETVLIFGVFDVLYSAAGAGDVTGVIYVDGAARPGAAVFGIVGHATIVFPVLAALNSGVPHTLALYARKTVAGGTASIESAGITTSLVILRFPQTITALEREEAPE